MDVLPLEGDIEQGLSAPTQFPGALLPLHFHTHRGAGGLVPLAPVVKVTAASSCPLISDPRSYCLVSETNLWSPQGSPSGDSAPQLKSERKLLLVKLSKPAVLAGPLSQVPPQSRSLLLCRFPGPAAGILSQQQEWSPLSVLCADTENTPGAS